MTVNSKTAATKARPIQEKTPLNNIITGICVICFILFIIFVIYSANGIFAFISIVPDLILLLFLVLGCYLIFFGFKQMIHINKAKRSEEELYGRIIEIVPLSHAHNPKCLVKVMCYSENYLKEYFYFTKDIENYKAGQYVCISVSWYYGDISRVIREDLVPEKKRQFLENLPLK